MTHNGKLTLYCKHQLLPKPSASYHLCHSCLGYSLQNWQIAVTFSLAHKGREACTGYDITSHGRDVTVRNGRPVAASWNLHPILPSLMAFFIHFLHWWLFLYTSFTVFFVFCFCTLPSLLAFLYTSFNGDFFSFSFFPFVKKKGGFRAQVNCCPDSCSLVPYSGGCCFSHRPHSAGESADIPLHDAAKHTQQTIRTGTCKNCTVRYWNKL